MNAAETFVPEIQKFDVAANHLYESIDCDLVESEYTLPSMVTRGDETPAISRTAYIDLDLLSTLESRIESLRKRNKCPVYYLGWGEQKAGPWEQDSAPSDFYLGVARAILLHLPPLVCESALFEGNQMPAHLLILVN